ncbi:MAG: hypothetical protein Rubg2KO_16680 [Rubricoccaceae bacterium]
MRGPVRQLPQAQDREGAGLARLDHLMRLHINSEEAGDVTLAVWGAKSKLKVRLGAEPEA